jgi:diadenosine tetraphosphate (Ap4A) HIT family hydrolase
VNYHYRSTRKRYKSFPKPEQCDFCHDSVTLQKAVLTTKHAYVVPNRVFYDIWELHDVTDHLLVVPKRHVHSLSELTPAERQDIMDILADYEGREYNVYARATASVNRSVFHQHTHLIKINNATSPRATFFIRKPWLLIKF